jgi:hypothetical protein
MKKCYGQGSCSCRRDGRRPDWPVYHNGDLECVNVIFKLFLAYGIYPTLTKKLKLFFYFSIHVRMVEMVGKGVDIVALRT